MHTYLIMFLETEEKPHRLICWRIWNVLCLLVFFLPLRRWLRITFDRNRNWVQHGNIENEMHAHNMHVAHTRHMHGSFDEKHNKTWHFLLSAITLNKWVFAFCARICIWWTALCSQKWHQLNGCQMFKNKWNITQKWEWSTKSSATKTISECKCKWRDVQYTETKYTN